MTNGLPEPEPYIYTDEDATKAFHSYKNFKDGNFREYQLETIIRVVNSELPVIIIVAPTGSGKSILGAVICKLLGNSAYLVHSKALQEQIHHDFPEFALLKGRNNYECINPDVMNFTKADNDKITKRTASDCPFREPRRKCGEFDECPYKVQKDIVVHRSLRILNYSYWLLESNYVGKLSNLNVLICDEADKLEDILLKTVSVQVSERQMKKFGIKEPRYKTACENGLKSWIEWAEESYDEVDSRYRRMEKVDGIPKNVLEEYATMISKLDRFRKIVDATWIYQGGEGKYGQFWKFMPTWITPEITDEILRRHANKIIMMSATMPPVQTVSQILGIPMMEMEYITVPSTFDPKNRPIHILNAGRLSAKTTDTEFPKMVECIKEILRKHKNDKGLIHTSSYKLAKLIMDNCDEDGRMMTHNTDNRAEMLERFKKSEKPVVMVSPSMERGVSLDDDLCRAILVVKMPFLDLGDKLTSTRLYGSGGAGKFWYKATSAQTLEQQCGRGVRSKDDYCEIYLLDSFIDDMIMKYPLMFSQYFRDCIIW